MKSWNYENFGTWPWLGSFQRSDRSFATERKWKERPRGFNWAKAKKSVRIWRAVCMIIGLDFATNNERENYSASFYVTYFNCQSNY